MTRLRGAGRVEEAEAAAALMEDAARGERVAAALRCSLAAARELVQGTVTRWEAAGKKAADAAATAGRARAAAEAAYLRDLSLRPYAAFDGGAREAERVADITADAAQALAAEAESAQQWMARASAAVAALEGEAGEDGSRGVAGASGLSVDVESCGECEDRLQDGDRCGSTEGELLSWDDVEEWEAAVAGGGDHDGVTEADALYAAACEAEAGAEGIGDFGEAAGGGDAPSPAGPVALLSPAALAEAGAADARWLADAEPRCAATLQAAAGAGGVGDELAAVEAAPRAAASPATLGAGHAPASEEEVSVAHWNTGNLHAGLGRTADRGAGARRREEPGSGASPETVQAARKMGWLLGQVAAAPPDVVFLYEVTGSLATWAIEHGLRDALKKAGFHARFVPGAGQRNGIVVAVLKGRAKLESATRLQERVVGASVRFACDRKTRTLVGIHGINAETTARDLADARRRSFARQLHGMQESIGGEAGGLAGGDFNRVVCGRMRVGGHALSGDDRRLRTWAGWTCGCCGDGDTRLGTVVGVSAGACDPTRWSTQRGRLKEPTAQIDFAVATGAERGLWTLRHALQATTAAGGNVGEYAVSDHAFMVYTRRVVQVAHLDTRRDVPLAIGSRGGDPRLREAYVARARGHDTALAESLHEAARIAAAGGNSRVGAVSAALVDVGRLAATEVRFERERARARPTGGNSSRQRYQMWAGWLRRALKWSACGVHPCDDVAAAALRFSGRLTAKACKQRLERRAAVAWRPLLACIRHNLRQAGRDESAAARAEDARLLEAAVEMKGDQVDALARMQRAWRALRARRASTALDKVWKDDRAPAKGEAPGSHTLIRYDEAEFKAELRNIGLKFVRSMADTPACMPAFKAWCGVFMENFDELRGADGGDFQLAKELTWEVFQEVLASMPGNKSVGAGGFSVELLRAAGIDTQRAFYTAMISDLRQQRVPENWRVVLYALLEKKDANPDVVAERREIALMAQDMKLLLQMVRRVSYQRIVGRIVSAQAGWLSGYGCADTGSIAARIIQQQARLQRPLYLLYIDLATFFPRCDREAITVAEVVHGLPKAVRELALLIYGSAHEPEKAVRCHYDSAAGLGDGFPNWMGALMGCVLSPDKAKLLLNTVIVAIAAVCKGVRVWGYGADAIERTWRAVAQMAFADDWLGTFESATELRRAWAIWRSWEAVSGSKIGVKKKAKTVVTGVRYENGKAVSTADPLLRLRGGGFVPFAHHDEVYKHVGVGRCASGDDTPAWKLFEGKVQVALARLRKMRRPSRNEFVMVSNALIGGLAGYYLQSLYISWEQAESIERRWRAIFRQKFGNTGEEDRSKPRALFYQQQGKKRQVRQHVWGVGLAALVACTNACVADVDDTPQRATARSAVALAMERWGCRTDPQRWRWGHLEAALECSLRNAKGRNLGDAWLLASLLLEREDDRQFEESEGARSGWTRHFSAEQEAEWGRWQGEAEEGDPLHRDAPHWTGCASAMLCEPASTGGLGIVPEHMLLHAGVVCVGHMCTSVVAVDGTVTWAWRTAESAQRHLPRVPKHGAAAAAWRRQLERLRAAGVPPCAPERAVVTGGLAGAFDAQPRGCATSGVDEQRVERLLDALEEPEVRARRSQESWARALQGCFPGVVPRPATEWRVGGCDRGSEAVGARYVFAIGDEQEPTARGGQARWLARGADGRGVVIGDEDGITVDDDGWANGHREQTSALLGRLHFDDGGRAADGDGFAVGVAEAAALPPALQLQVRASCALLAATVPVISQWPTAKTLAKEGKRATSVAPAGGPAASSEPAGVAPGAQRAAAEGGERAASAGGKPDAVTRGARRAESANGGSALGAGGSPDAVTGVPGGRGAGRREPATEKAFDFSKPHLNTAVQARNRRTLATWQARIRATAVYTLDGSRTTVGAGDEREHVVSRAAIRHDGHVLRGRLHVPEGADNYLAELAAQLDAAAAEDIGGRIIVIFDATGPPIAMRKLMRASNRRRQGRYVGGWLEALMRLLDRQEVVVFLWQTSHVGSPVNEWADMEAGEAALCDVATPVPRVASGFASMRYSRPRRSTHEWAAPLAGGVVRRRLAAALADTQVHDHFDVPALSLPDGTQRTCDAVLSQRCQFGDRRRFVGRLRRALRPQESCPFGCTSEAGGPERFTWEHVQLRCGQHDIVEGRRGWIQSCEEAAATAKDEGVTTPLEQIVDAMRLASGGVPDTRRGRIAPAGALRTEQEVSLRRLVGGLVRCSGALRADRSARLRAAYVNMTVRGARLQQIAGELVRANEEELTERVRQLGLAGRVAVRWRAAVGAAGPARAAALREVYVAASRAAHRIALVRGVDPATEPPRLETWQLARWAAEPWAAALHSCVAAGGREVRHRIRAPGNVALATRDGQRRPGGTAGSQWRLLALAQRWRLRARMRQARREDEAGAHVDGGAVVDEEAMRLCTMAVGERRLMETLKFYVGASCVREAEAGSPLQQGLIESEARASRHYHDGGGRRAEQRRTAERETRLVAHAARRLKRYGGQLMGPSLPGAFSRGRAVTGLSGRTLADTGQQIHVEITKRRRRHSAGGPQGGAGPAGPDRYGRWPIERVLEVRRSSTREQTVQARVRWRGPDPATGLPWRDSWIVVAWGATTVIRDDIAGMLAVKYGDSLPTRRCAGDGATAAVPDPPKVAAARARWQGRWSVLRGRRGADGVSEGGNEAGSQGEGEPPRSSVSVTIDQDASSSDAAGDGAPGADNRKRRRGEESDEERDRPLRQAASSRHPAALGPPQAEEGASAHET